MDNKFIIDNLLMQNESEHLEFKAHFDERIIAKDVTAMLNGSGGTILIGVNEEKAVVGVSSDLVVKKLLHSLMNKIRPSAPIDVQSVEYDGKTVLLISVWEGAQKPYLRWAQKEVLHQLRQLAICCKTERNRTIIGKGCQS